MSLIEDEEVSQASMDQLLVSNNLSYRLPSSLSVVVKRSSIKHYADRTEYKGGQNAIITMNGGDQYVDGKNSFFCFQLGFEGPDSAKVGTGAGLLNCIESCILTSESGVEISRFESINNYQSADIRYRYPREWIDSQGSMFAMPPTRLEDGAATTDLADVDLKAVVDANERDSYFCIPMSLISPVFGSNNLLMGMGLMSGLKVEISFTPNEVAFKRGANDVANKYLIKDAYILTDTYMLSDAVLGSLNEQSATNSLELVWEETAHVQGGVEENSTNIVQDSKLAVSRAQSVWTKFRDSTQSETMDADSFAASRAWVDRFGYRLAGLHFPNQQVDRLTEMLAMAYQNWDKNRHPYKGCAVSLDNFRPKGDTNLYDNSGVLCTTLERSNTLSLSGLPIGSGRVLSLIGKFAGGGGPGGNANQKRIDMYIQYVKLCRVFIDRVVVKS